MEILNNGNVLTVNDDSRSYEIVSDPATLRYLEGQVTSRGLLSIPIPGHLPVGNQQQEDAELVINDPQCLQPCPECDRRDSCDRSTVRNQVDDRNFAPFGTDHLDADGNEPAITSDPQPVPRDNGPQSGFAPFGLRAEEYIPESEI